MQFLPLIAVLHLATATPTQHIAVFGKNATVSFIDHPPAADKAQAAFLEQFHRDIRHPAPFAEALPLTDFPVYGRNVPGAHGEIQFHATFTGALVTKVALEGLLPLHRYILTLNGNPERPGNDRLATPVPGNERERYFDFQTITTDKKGQYLAEYAIALQPGPYEVRFYVKDTADFKIVLYHDFFPFTVK